MTSSNTKITLLAALVILLGGCASGGGGPSTPTSPTASTPPTTTTSPVTIYQQTTFNSSKAVTAYSFPPTAAATLTYSTSATVPWTFKATSSKGVSLVSVTGVPKSSTTFFTDSLDSNLTLPTKSFHNSGGTTGVVLMLYYNDQRFGYWYDKTAGTHDWFSFGPLTPTTTLPTSGTASYAGQAGGNYFSGGTMYRTSAYMKATATFGTSSSPGTLTFSTTGTDMISNANAKAGTGTVASQPSLNLSGNLKISGNLFTGQVAAVGLGTTPLAGNVHGGFYGPGITKTKGTSVVGSPAEVGGTYILANTAKTEVLVGAFGGAVTP